MTIIYRDKTTNDRIIIPTHGEFDNRWSVECVEVIVNVDKRLVYRKAFMPVSILERHYRKEEL